MRTKTGQKRITRTPVGLRGLEENLKSKGGLLRGRSEKHLALCAFGGKAVGPADELEAGSSQEERKGKSDK